MSRVWAAADGYEGVTHAGVAIVAADSGLVLVVQRADDPEDAPGVRQTWEFPGGGLDDGEEPLAGALREYVEETGFAIPDGEVVNGWRGGDQEQYQGFVIAVPTTFDVSAFVPNDEVQAVAWIPPKAPRDMTMREEFSNFDWSVLDAAVSGNDEGAEMTDNDTMVAATQVGTAEDYLRVDESTGETVGTASVPDSEEPSLSMLDLVTGPIPIHGVLAPEDVQSGDGRGFNAGAITSRDYRLPFMWQKQQVQHHDTAFTVGSVDRLMRKDGLIHWQGLLMPSNDASEFAEMLAFFGRYPVSVDGENANLDKEKTNSTGVVWFDAVRAAGLTAVAVSAFPEAYVAFGPHPDMPEETSEEFSVLTASGDLVTFDRGPGWVTNPKETKRLHDYWTKKGQPGYEKIGWGTPGDFTRAKKLIGEKIGANSPEDLRFLNQIIAQWHYDALGYWPGDLDKPGNKTSAEARAERAAKRAAASITREGITGDQKGWEAVLVSSVSGNRVFPPIEYFHRQDDHGALVIKDPDENGFIHTYGYAGEWGVCHVGMAGQCVEPPRTYSDDYPQFHLGTTKVEGGVIYTGVLTYGVGHRDAETILSESPEQAFFDNINNAWAAVRVGEDERGIWYSGVVLPGVPEDHLTKIAASGQVSGEWLHGEMRACLTVNVPGYAVERPSAAYDDDGNVIALAASAFGGIGDAPCDPTPAERMDALRKIDAEVRFEALRAQWGAR